MDAAAEQKSAAAAVRQMVVAMDEPVRMPAAVPMPAAQEARCSAEWCVLKTLDAARRPQGAGEVGQM